MDIYSRIILKYHKKYTTFLKRCAEIDFSKVHSKVTVVVIYHNEMLSVLVRMVIAVERKAEKTNAFEWAINYLINGPMDG